MFATLRSVHLVVVLIALLPGAVSWWSGRRLARHTDDPALPERLAAHRRRNGVMFGASIAVFAWLALFSNLHAVLAMFLGGFAMYTGLLAAAYPLRRALYRETWSFRSYLLFYPRALIGMFGFWLLTANLPLLATVAKDWDWIVAIGLGAVLAVWNSRQADVIRWCLRTESLSEGQVLAGCRDLAHTCGLPHTRFEVINLGGGVVPNAMALPSLRGSSVLFTNTVLERFDRPEILAICAHELAHFDHYNPARLRRFNVVNYVLIGLGIASAPVARVAGADWGVLLTMVWFATIVFAMAVRARGKQQQETACDVRAVELTGDADALIRGLTKLYTIARLPRRLDQQTERAATHPSLARRIRDIRKAAGSVPVPLSSARTFTSADGHTVVTFDDAGVRWFERDALTHSLSYGQMTELRVQVKPGRKARLVAKGAETSRWEFTLQDADIAGVQAVLDVVDGRLADPPPAAPTVHPRVQRILVLTIAGVGLAFSQIAVAFVALLAWKKPTTPLLVGAGTAAVTAAAILHRDYGGEYLLAASLPVVILGVMFLGLAWGHRKASQTGTRPYIAILALAAACTVVAVTMNGVDIVSLHRSARAIPSATVLLAALAGTLVSSQTRRERLAGVSVGVFALAVGSAASTAFLDRFANDAFVVEAPPLRWVVLNADPVQTFSVPDGTSRIDLSPNSRYVATYEDRDVDSERDPTIHVGRVEGALVSVQANDVAFVGDDKLLVVRSDRQGTTLRVENLDAPREVIWERFVRDLSATSLFLDRAAARWGLLGWDGDESIMRVEGLLDGTAVEEKRWSLPRDAADGFIAAMTTAGADALVLETRYERGLLAGALPWRWTWAHVLLRPNTVSQYAKLTAHGRQNLGNSKLEVNCVANVMPNGALACTAYDGSRTRVVTISATTGHVDGIGWLEGRFVSDQRTVRGWLTGWAGAYPVAISVTTGEAFRMPAFGTMNLAPVAGNRLAALTVGNDRSDGLAVRVYAVSSNTRATDGERREANPAMQATRR